MGEEKKIWKRYVIRFPTQKTYWKPEHQARINLLNNQTVQQLKLQVTERKLAHITNKFSLVDVNAQKPRTKHPASGKKKSPDQLKIEKIPWIEGYVRRTIYLGKMLLGI